jgi:hypothetical protein
MSFRKISVLIGTILALVLAAAGASFAGDEPTPIARGPHISGVVRYQPGAAAGTAAATTTACSRPGSGNYLTNCNGQGRPVNETWMVGNGSLYVAGANDYNSYNGQGQDGFYWSATGTSWNDAGPLDVFPHNTNNAAGDPGLALGTDASGNAVAYYSSLFFNFHNCNVGGVELTVGSYNQGTNSWSWGTPVQFAADSRSQFQDKPAIALDQANGKVLVSWTQFGSCSGVNVTSPIRVAVAPTSSPSSFTTLANVPGSTFSQGSSIVADGSGGFWLAWEEYPSSSATSGLGIRLAHWTGSAWANLDGTGNDYVTVSPSTFEDLSSPLSGFKFRDDSFPALTLVSGVPVVTWTAFDTTQDPTRGAQTQKGRDYVFFAGSAATPLTGSTLVRLANFGAGSGGHQFFPAIAPSGTGVYVSYSQENLDANGKSLGSYDQYKAHVTAAGIDSGPTRVSTASSFPNNDNFFSGQFIGDYNGLATDASGGAHSIWTDIRGPDPFYNTWEMDAMTAFSP